MCIIYAGNYAKCDLTVPYALIYILTIGLKSIMYRHGKVGYQTTHRYFVCQASQLITRPGYSTTGKLETNDECECIFCSNIDCFRGWRVKWKDDMRWTWKWHEHSERLVEANLDSWIANLFQRKHNHITTSLYFVSFLQTVLSEGLTPDDVGIQSSSSHGFNLVYLVYSHKKGRHSECRYHSFIDRNLIDRT